MTEAEILETTYDDICTVFRPISTVSENTGETVYKTGLNGFCIYQDIPCGLSSQTGGKPVNTGSVIETDVEYVLFYHPRYEIRKGDTVLIKHLGMTYQVLAGKARNYVSHWELPIKEDDIA